VVPAEAGVKGEAESLRLKEKFLLRALLFWLNKGLSRMTIFVSGPDKDNEGMGISLAKVRELKEMPPDDQLEEWLSPALRSLRRAVKVFDGAAPIPKARQFDLDVAKLGPDRKVFEMPLTEVPRSARPTVDTAGQASRGTTGEAAPKEGPTLWFRDLFTVLPFQVTERKFVFALYEMTPNYNVEDLKDVPYRLTLRPLAGERCQVSYYDPLADNTLPATVAERKADSLTIELPIIDTPRLLTIEEKE